MSEVIVILVNGEVLTDIHQSSIIDQKKKADLLAEGLLPILRSKLNIALMHGNKPQVGYVLYRSELASHVIHQIPLDICGADTQGATGYMLSQSMINALRRNKSRRSVMSIITQTIVNQDSQDYQKYNREIGPWLDRDRAEQRRQLYGWNIVQKPGYGYRRVVPSPPPLEIVEMEGIKQLTNSGTVVVAAGGGGIPVIADQDGLLEGLEVVVDTDYVASIMGRELEAKIMLMIIEDNVKFSEAGLYLPEYQHLSLEQFLEVEHKTSSDFVKRKIRSVENFLENNGKQVVITTLPELDKTLRKESGLWIGEVSQEEDLTSFVFPELEPAPQS
jgi:carbamate kinase